MPAPRPIYGVSVDQMAAYSNGTNPRTLIEIKTPASTGIVPVMWWVEFDGVTATNVPVRVDFGIYSAATGNVAGTNATAATPALINYGNRGLASQCTVLTSSTITTTAEAGTATYAEYHRVPPTSGLYIQEPLGLEWTVGASSFFRIRVLAAAAVNATAGVRWTE